MRIPVARLVFVFLLFCSLAVTRGHASSSSSDVIPDAAGLTEMENRANTADPRDRAFRYAELCHLYTRIAGQQIASGDMDRATLTLKQVEHFAEMVHAGLAGDQRKLKNLKNAEMLAEQATHRLRELLHTVSTEDQAVVQETLKRLTKVNDELLATVFAH